MSSSSLVTCLECRYRSRPKKELTLRSRVRCPQCGCIFQAPQTVEPTVETDLRSMLGQGAETRYAATAPHSEPLARSGGKRSPDRLVGGKPDRFTGPRTFMAVLSLFAVGAIVYGIGVWFQDTTKEIDRVGKQAAEARRKLATGKPFPAKKKPVASRAGATPPQ